MGTLNLISNQQAKHRFYLKIASTLLLVLLSGFFMAGMAMPKEQKTIVPVRHGEQKLAIKKLNNELKQLKRLHKNSHKYVKKKPVTHLKTWRIKYSRAEKIASMLSDKQGSLLTKKAFIKVDSRSNSLYVIDVNERLRRLDELIKQIDVPIKQVVIKAKMVSIDKTIERDLGVEFGSLLPKSRAKPNHLGTAKPGSYSLAVAKLANGSLLDVKLKALEKAGSAELISSPTLFTSDQRSAFIESGEEVPYQEVSEGGGTAVAFKKAVLGLKVTPKVLPGKQVSLAIEIRQDRPSARLVQGVPTISTQKMKTNVIAIDGQTIVLGGIYEQNNEQGESGLPFISRLPIIGRLLNEHSIRRNKRELLIFVTPTVVNT